MNDPHDFLTEVKDEKSFLVFANALLQDRRENQTTWENGTLEEFLEAAIAWGQSTDIGASQGLAGQSPWQRFAAFLYCGKIYE